MKNSHIKVPILAILSNQGVKRSLILLVLNLYTFIVYNLQKANSLCSAKTSRFGFSLTHCSNDLFLLTYHIIYSSFCTRYSLVTLLFPRLLLWNKTYLSWYLNSIILVYYTNCLETIYNFQDRIKAIYVEITLDSSQPAIRLNILILGCKISLVI